MGDDSSLEDRSRQRRRHMVAHTATSFEDAEAWDLEFWQGLTPEERLSALVAIRRDEEVVQGRYGRAAAFWVDLDSLIAIKKGIDHPRHREDVRVLELVRERKKKG